MNHLGRLSATRIFSVPPTLLASALFVWAWLLATAGLSPVFADEVPPSDTKGELLLFDFGDGNEKQVRDAAIARFYTRYPNVKVTNQFTPVSSWAEYIDKLTAQVAAGQAPDLIHISSEGAQLAIQRKLLAPLDSYANSDASSKDLSSDVDSALLKEFTVDGKLYLMPVAWNSMMIYYNTKVFQEAGIPRPADNWTWDDFLVLAKRLTSGEGPGKKFGFAIPYSNFGLTSFWYSNGTAVLKKNLTESNLKDPNFLEAVQFIDGLVRDQKVSPDPARRVAATTDPNAIFELLATRQIAMTGGGRWAIQFFKASQFSDYDLLPWPKNKSQRTVFITDGWGISTKAKQKAVAWEMVKELASGKTELQTADSAPPYPPGERSLNRRSFWPSRDMQPSFIKAFPTRRPFKLPPATVTWRGF